MSVKYYCDRCDMEIKTKNEKDSYVLYIGDKPDGTCSLYRGYGTNKEICRFCKNRFDSFMKMEKE